MPLFNVPLEDMSAFPDETFDVSLCISTIEHVDDHDTAFRELVRITKSGGYIMITSDYFRDLPHFEQSASRHLQVTPYREEFVLDLPNRFGVRFVGPTDLAYAGDFVHNYSFCNICLQKGK
jgi:ubiquinone/menaquinone biosynthesis C-methylase UbiE